ncbi:hypothetical protein XPA_001409 [Xanthoria parietina]
MFQALMDASSANQMHNGRAALTQRRLYPSSGDFLLWLLNFVFAVTTLLYSLSRPARTLLHCGPEGYSSPRQHCLSSSTLFILVVVLPEGMTLALPQTNFQPHISALHPSDY